MNKSLQEEMICTATWPAQIPDDQWAVYQRVIELAQAREIPFAIGGGFAAISYTGQWRNTKDLDFFILPEHRQAMIQAVTDTGLSDYFAVKEYDRGWIYRSHQGDTIVDLIWMMANRRAQVDKAWLERGPEIDVRGLKLRLIPPEETLWCKLYILQRDRCDWSDALNIVYSLGPELDWQHLVNRMQEDTPLLSALLSVFGWICPDRAHDLPHWLWDYIHSAPPEPQSCQEVALQRADRLDTRPWFCPTLEKKTRAA